MDIQNKTQREIKFRGWHTQQKVMFSAEEMAKDQLTLLPTGEFINVSGTSILLSEIYLKDEFIPLQFTGLHDKNGKELYEGDILGDNWRGGYVDYCDKCKSFQYFMQGVGCFWCSGDVRWDEIVEDDGKLVIIGNIYQNSHLLDK